MNRWEYNFPPVSNKEWVARIKKDLKETTLESLQSEWWPGEKINPFHYAPVDPNNQVFLPDRYFQKPPLLTEWFETANIDTFDLNKSILTALSHGVKSIICDIRHALPQMEKLWDDVHLDMIQFSLNLHPVHMRENKSDLLPEGITIRIARENITSEDLIRLARLYNAGKNKLIFTYSISDNDNWLESTAQLFAAIAADYRNWKSSELNGNYLDLCRIIFQPDTLFFKQIIQTRAIQLVWLNLCAELDHDENMLSPVECHIKPEGITDPDRYLLRASSSCLAAALSGVDSICVHHIEDPALPGFYKRIDQNIQHLLELESGIYKGIDPVGGSYAVDYYSAMWTEKILEKVGGVDVMNFRQKEG